VREYAIKVQKRRFFDYANLKHLAPKLEGSFGDLGNCSEGDQLSKSDSKGGLFWGSQFGESVSLARENDLIKSLVERSTLEIFLGLLGKTSFF